ncbi:MAG: ABC transporter permease [Bacteroidota bacterium]
MIKTWAEHFFRWYCRPEFLEDILGDLDELYLRQLKKTNEAKANRMFAWEIIRLFRPAIIRPDVLRQSPITRDMLQNFFKIGFRNLWRQPGYTAIHIFGLALGLTAFLFINQYISFEKGYDSFHYHPDRLYRLTTDDYVEGKIQTRDAMSFAPSGKALQNELPEVVNYTTTYKTRRMVLKKGEAPIEENGVIAVDSNFMNLFGYETLKGDPSTMLNEPHTIVLSETMAQKYFGNNDPMGQTIEVLGGFNRPFRVTGIIKDPPQNTHYTFNALVSLKSYQARIERDNWNGFNYYTYLLLAKDTDVTALNAKLPDLSRKFMGDDSRLRFNIQPILDIHLKSDFTYEPEIHGSARAVRFLSIISIFILLIAWVNYINLSTAKAINRAKEVGLRKVVGARKIQLIVQFFVEALLVNFMGALLALILAQILLPYFNGLVGKQVMTHAWTNVSFLSKLGLFFLLGALLTGIYPALVLSSFRPMGVLKGNFGRSKQGTLMRKTLVVVQFAASLILIASTITVYQQIRFMTNSDLGINTDQVLGLRNPGDRGGDEDAYESTYKAFSEELEKLGTVQKVAGISNLPGGGSSDISSAAGGFTILGHTEFIESTIYINSMTDQLPEALNLELIEGRVFDEDMAMDTLSLMVNEAFLELANISDPKSVINDRIRFGRDPENDQWLIAGIVKDYNRSSLKNSVEPTVFFMNETPLNTVVKMEANNMNKGIGEIQQVWSRFFPDSPFTYSFLDQRFEKLYLEDQRFGYIFLNFSILAIFVATIGLFGLASFLSTQRTKEVGVRKVIGASVNQIVMLFFKDFLWLILIAVFIGIPITYFGMSEWLSSYANRINFPWLFLVLAIIAICGIAFITVSYQIWKIARLNPAQTIRYE